MSSIKEVKHTAHNCAVREKSKDSHERKGALKIKLAHNCELVQENYGFDYLDLSNGRLVFAHGKKIRIRSFSRERFHVGKGYIEEETASLTLFNDSATSHFTTDISINDFRALFHAFNPDEVNDELNVLSKSEEEVIATDTDQVPMAGTNNA